MGPRAQRAEEARRRYAAGEDLKQIAADLKMHPRTVTRVVGLKLRRGRPTAFACVREAYGRYQRGEELDDIAAAMEVKRVTVMRWLRRKGIKLGQHLCYQEALLLLRRGMLQKDVAQKLGVTLLTVNRWAREALGPTPITLGSRAHVILSMYLSGARRVSIAKVLHISRQEVDDICEEFAPPREPQEQVLADRGVELPGSPTAQAAEAPLRMVVPLPTRRGRRVKGLPTIVPEAPLPNLAPSDRLRLALFGSLAPPEGFRGKPGDATEELAPDATP